MTPKDASTARREHAVSTFFALTGNRVEALLLDRITFWHAKATYADARGDIWLIRCADEFARDGVPYSVLTIRRALGRLAEKGFIVMRKGWHRFRSDDDGRPITNAFYLRPGDPNRQTEEVCQDIENRYADRPQKSVKTDLDGLSLYINRRTTQENEPGDAARLSSAGKEPFTISGESGGNKEDETTEPLIMPSASEIVGKLSAKPLPKADRSRETMSSTELHKEFVHWIKAAYPDERPPLPTGMALGQFKLYLRRCREMGVKDAVAVEAIEHVCMAWDAFKQYALKRGHWQSKSLARPTAQTFAQCPEMILDWRDREAKPVGAPGSFVAAVSEGGFTPKPITFDK